MPDPNPIQQTVMEFIQRELVTGDDVFIDPEENLFTSGHIDSLGIMRLVAHLETTLKIKIPPTDLIPENFRSVSVMTTYIESLRE